MWQYNSLKEGRNKDDCIVQNNGCSMRQYNNLLEGWDKDACKVQDKRVVA